MTAHASQHPSVPALLSLEGEAFVRQAYRRILNREADAAGLQACLGRLSAGVPKERILSELEATPEGRLVARRRGGPALGAAAASQAAVPVRRLPGLPPFDDELSDLPHVDQVLALPDERTFLRAAYLQVLGRPADEQGLAAGKEFLGSGATRVDMLRVLATSDEGRAAGRRVAGLAALLEAATAPSAAPPAAAPVSELLAIADDEAFLRAAYLQILGRPAEPEGITACRRFMADGASRVAVLRVLAESDEGVAAKRSVPGLEEALKADAARPGTVATQAGRPPVAPSHVNELLDTDRDDAFLMAAYWHLLGRPTDTGGQALYGGLLRKGWSRVFVLRELNRSDEARKRGVNLPGLERLLAGYAKAQQRNWTGWFFRNVAGAESDLPADRRLRVIYRHAIGDDS